MPIEFKCNHCQNVLKVADEHAGKSARCPSCKEVTSIPLQSDDGFGLPELQPFEDSPSPFADPSVPTKQFGAENPYRSPSAAKVPSSRPRSGALTPAAASFDSIFSYAWNCWKDNLGLMVAMIATAFAISFVIGIVIYFVETAMVGMNIHESMIYLTSFTMNIASNIVSVFLQLGQIKICLKLARRQQTDLGDLFTCGDKLLPAFVAGMIFGLMTVIGFILLIIPGIFVILLFWSYVYLIADNRAGISDSLSLGLEIGKLNLGASFMMFLIAFLLVIAGILMCLVGLLFTVGLASMIFAVGYLRMTSQL